MNFILKLVVYYLNCLLNVMENYWVFLLCLYPAAVIVSLIHETGHYVVNKTLGLKVSKVSIGGGKKPLLKIGKFEFGFWLDSFVRTENPEMLSMDEHQNEKVLLLMSAGIIMQIVAGIIIIFIPLNIFVATFGILNVAIMLYNSLPIKTKKFMTDGGKISKTIGCMMTKRKILDELI